MFPAWRSPWKKPCTSTPSTTVCTPIRSRRSGVDARCLHALDVAEAEAVDPLHREHALADELPVHLRHAGVGDPLAVEDRPHPIHVVRLEAEVHLLVERAGEVLGERPGRADRRLRDALEHLAHEEEGAQVVAHLGLEPRPLHLHHHSTAIEQRGRVDMRDRRGRDRGVVELAERAPQRAAEVLLDHPAGLDAGERRHAVAQRRELRRPRLGEQARARRDHLADLHVGGPEVREGLPEAPGEWLGAPSGVLREGAADLDGSSGDATSLHGPHPRNERAPSPPDGILDAGSTRGVR